MIARSGKQQRKLSARHGLTLFEIVVSVSILAGSLAALGQLIATGNQASVSARFHTEAVFRCESKLSEILAGIEPMTPTDASPFEDDESGYWSWSLEINETAHIDVLGLVVTVKRYGKDETLAASYSLQRMVRDPQLYIDAATEAADAESLLEAAE